MKRLILPLLVAIAIPSLSARSLNVTSAGNVTYSFTDTQTGVMTYSNGGQQVTVAGRTFTVADLAKLSVVDADVAKNTVNVVYSDSKASVVIAGNIAQYIDATVDGGYVTVTQSADVDDTVGEITYNLTGSTSAGAFTLNASYKATIELDGVSITSLKGAAIDIQSGKRTNLKVVDGTTNTLVDAAGGSHKAALYCKGHLEFKQKGTLRVTGNTAHAIAAKEYITIKNSKVYVLKSVKDGLNCNQYFAMESGTLDISGVGDDGMQVSFKDATDREADDTGSFSMTGGTINVSASATATKAIKIDGDFTVSGGTITASVSGGGMWDSTASKTKASSCISADGNILISGGSFNLKATGSGGKGMSCDGEFTTTGGDFVIATTGGLYYNNGRTENTNYTADAGNIASNYKSSPKCIKSDSNVNINGGNFDLSTKCNGGEGIESKKVLTVNDGYIKVRSYDDGLNSSSNMYIKGGTLNIIALKADGLDSNASMYISGGTIMTFGGTGAEEGLDIDSGTMEFTGGYILAVGGRNSTPNKSSSTQPYISGTMTLTAGADLNVATSTGTHMYTFTIPADYSQGNSVVVSVPDMVVGTSYKLTCGSRTLTATAAQYGSSSGGGPGGRW